MSTIYTPYTKIAKSVFDNKLKTIQPEPIILNRSDSNVAEKSAQIHANKGYAKTLLIEEITTRWSQLDVSPNSEQARADVHTLLYLMDNLHFR